MEQLFFAVKAYLKINSLVKIKRRCTNLWQLNAQGYGYGLLVCPDYILELLKRNIDIRSTERQSRYGSLNLICPKNKRESENARTFKVSAIRFWN